MSDVLPIQRVTDLYCEGIQDPIPYRGSPADFEEQCEIARSNAGRIGKRAYGLRWTMPSGERVVLDLSRTRVIAMVERRVSS